MANEHLNNNADGAPQSVLAEGTRGTAGASTPVATESIGSVDSGDATRPDGPGTLGASVGAGGTDAGTYTAHSKADLSTPQGFVADS